MPENSSNVRTIAIVIALAAGFALLPRAMARMTTQVEAKDAPDFTAKVVLNAPDPATKELSLASLRGKPVVLDFWATWCGPCQAEMPIVNGISQRYRDKGLVVVGVNTSDGEGLAAGFGKKRGVSFPLVYDEDNVVAHKFGVDNLPTLVVLSKEGKVVAVRHGITSDADLDKLVKSVL